MNHPEKIREQRLRRAADRQGLALSRSRRRDPWALDFGRYRLDPIGHEAPEHSGPSFTLTLDDVEATLRPSTEEDDEADRPAA